VEFIKKLEQVLAVKVQHIEKKISLRNSVYYVEAITAENIEQKYIIKEHIHSSTGDEVLILNTLKRRGVNVPQIIWHDQRFIVMQYIQGILLTDLLTDLEADRVLWINELARWLYKLHGIIDDLGEFCLCMSDLNLRNFIFDGREFYGVDFENICFYPPERDIGVICAFILNNDPMFEQWKYSICSSLIRAYETAHGCRRMTKLDHQAIRHYLIEELNVAAQRRESQRHYLNSKIKELSCMPPQRLFNMAVSAADAG
jgi:tRNA A-37 threonylcarbamoyl transferase component Bud32